MSFPFETDKNILQKKVTVPKEYEIDFNSGQLTGKIVEGAEAVKIWIYNVLKTPRYRYNIFSWDYGNEIEDLIGQSYTQAFLEAETRRMVEDCLLINDNISSISDFKVVSENDKLSILFTANTLFGEVNINV